jgi:hypothetical protein
VVDDHGQIAVALLVSDLVDPDPDEPVQRVELLAGLADDPVDGRSDRRPADPQQLGDHRHPVRAVGGLWLCRSLVPSGLRAVVVPSGCRVTFQPH